MKKPTDSRAKHFAPQKHRGLEAALIQRLGQEFPRLGGPRILNLCAEMIMEIIDTHIVSAERIGHGQVLWCAIDIGEIPRKGKTAQNTRMKPVILSLHDPRDLEGYLDRTRTLSQIREDRAVRLCHQAHEQGALLSGSDLSLLLGISDATVSQLLIDHETRNDVVVPRRATLHDMGSGVTHKRIICRKRYLEGKEPNIVARETYHSLEAVDRYLGQYDRVRHCRQEGMSPRETAHILRCGERLVKEYLEIDDQINEARAEKS
jgi:hypothetical protein